MPATCDRLPDEPPETTTRYRLQRRLRWVKRPAGQGSAAHSHEPQVKKGRLTHKLSDTAHQPPPNGHQSHEHPARPPPGAPTSRVYKNPHKYGGWKHLQRQPQPSAAQPGAA